MSNGIHATAVIDSSAKLGLDISVGPYAVIGAESTLGDGCQVGAHAVIGPWTRLGQACRVFPHAVIGQEPQDLKYQGEKTWLICGDRNVFREFCTLNRAVGEGGETQVGADNLFMAYSHVAHDCQVGSHVVMANSSALAGHVTVEDHVVIGGLTGIHQFSRIGRYAMVGGGSSISKDVVPFAIISGDVPAIFGLNLVGLRRAKFEPAQIKLLDEAFRLLFRDKLNTKQALEEIAKLTPDSHLAHLTGFIQHSQRGIHK